MPDPVILIDLSDFRPSAAEIVWRSLDPELIAEKVKELREPKPYTLKQLRRQRAD